MNRCIKQVARNMIRILLLKVLTNEKRGLLTVVAFDRSPFKLFSLWFSYKSMQAPSVTTQRTLFLSFAINNCFQTSDEKLLAVLELVLGDFFTIIKPLSGTAPNVTSVFLFVWRIFVCASAIIAMTLKVTTSVLPISVRYLYRNTKHRVDFPRYLKRYRGGVQYRCFT